MLAPLLLAATSFCATVQLFSVSDTLPARLAAAALPDADCTRFPETVLLVRLTLARLPLACCALARLLAATAPPDSDAMLFDSSLVARLKPGVPTVDTLGAAR